MVAEVIILSSVRSLNRLFDYNIDEKTIEEVEIGSRVFVQFGNSKTLSDAIVINIKKESSYKLKSIVSINDEFKLSKNNIELAKWMSKRYFCNISECVKLMLPPGTLSQDVDKRIKEKIEKKIYLNISKEKIEELILGKEIKTEKQKILLEFLLNNAEGYTFKEIENQIGISYGVSKNLLDKGYLLFKDEQVKRNPFENKKELRKTKNLILTDEQQEVFEYVKSKLNIFDEYLIFGVTGSGKTEIYLQLIEETINQGKSAIILVPEISLTPQMVNRFIARFGDCIAILHSKLSAGERYDQWQKIKNDEIKIVIGPRSGIFAPINNLGIVIIDEEHDGSYKSDMTPRYNVKDISKYICEKNNIPLVLGSATPSLESYYKSEIGEIKRFNLTKRANEAELPEVFVVDLKEELVKGNKSMISILLYEKIKQNLENKKQTILFLNRRGFSTFIICRDCGYVAMCKNCNVSLTLHRNTNTLKCHYCGYESVNHANCPECTSQNIRHFGTGTQKLELEINKIFKEATTIRMDIDTVSKKNSHEQILDRFQDEAIDILIGTQMVVKGHHFPNVTLVGVITADITLNLNDFRANEKTFQLITQVAGRAGREQDKGEVVVQTYNPESFSVVAAKNQDYISFYNTEINIRKQLKNPPFCDIILIEISDENESFVINGANSIYNILLKLYNLNKNKYDKLNMKIFKPIESPVSKIKNRFRFRIVLKCNFNDEIINLIERMYEEIKKSNITVRVITDLNPNSLM